MSFHGENLGPCSNVYFRLLEWDHAGDVMHGHHHQFDHATLVTRGGVTVSWTDPKTKERVSRQYFAGAKFPTPASIMHEIVALEDETQCYCLFAVRDLEGHVLDAAEIGSRPVMGF